MASYVLYDLIRAVSHLHSAGVIHGDIKPSNFLMSASNVPMLCDLEVARRTGNQSCASSTVSYLVGGTMKFLAPELCDPVTGMRLASIPATYASDSFALGCTIEAYMTAAPIAPLLQRTASTWMSHMTEMVSGLMQKEPKTRLTICAALEDEKLHAAMRCSSPMASPAHWVKMPGSQFIHIKDGNTLVALQKCLSHDSVALPLGLGVDQADPFPESYSELVLVAAWRNENEPLWSSYAARRHQVAAECARVGGAPQHHSSAPLPHALHDLEGFTSTWAGANETYALHSASPAAMLQILQGGLNERYSGDGTGAMFGHGVYFSEDAGKSDQYALMDAAPGPYDASRYAPNNRRPWLGYERQQLEIFHQMLYGEQNIRHPGDVFYVLLCRVTLGMCLRTRDGTMSEGADRRPLYAEGRNGCVNRRELAQVSGIQPSFPHHALFVESCTDYPSPCTHSPRCCVARFDEIVLFHADQAYPEYLLAYHRK
eukprot:gnl/TRDRNA2_/TRDRNA2_153486_c2_seq1.p1 gnl/TRDRNA2_/TRDRNA2_153486_c2~~gnl/TRDRNA2_/TRDRNA2_153486_c2_seq1.p1  ORF type:complete len:520 (+),score=57.01 gnl/TRDRNA2_/TRDRNA2_153486_c2_seq1:108-1562(+)